MSASIGRSLRVPGLLLGCLVVLVIGGRAATEADDPRPPAPGKQIATVKAADCSANVTTQKASVTPNEVIPYWRDGKNFRVKLVFTVQSEYDAFANQQAYLCYSEDGGPEIKWEFAGSHRVIGANMTYLVKFKAHKPRAGPGARKDDRGSGTGRIIVTDGMGVTPAYLVQQALDDLEEL